jgi:plastocyanin
MRRIIPLAVVALVALAVPTFPAQAASVSIVDFAFNPDSTTIEQGESVTWTNNGGTGHTSTQNSPLALWNSPGVSIAPGNSYEFTIQAAGTYPYHCNVHPTLMTGTIRVPLIADMTTGTPATTFTFTVTAVVQAGFVYDVQKKKGNGKWKDWKMGVAGPTVAFNPAKAATYRFRARLHRSSNDAVSGYSQKTKIVVS